MIFLLFNPYFSYFKVFSLSSPAAQTDYRYSDFKNCKSVMDKAELFFNSSSNMRVITSPTRNIISECNAHTALEIILPVTFDHSFGITFTVSQLDMQKEKVLKWREVRLICFAHFFTLEGNKLLLLSKLLSELAISKYLL